ncbi:MAG: DNA primase [Candidatus Polarisedimenticolaceae bacterium]|nr:DNA primase [Candidatus Polarisedimenticolaceae bacterium]
MAGKIPRDFIDDLLTRVDIVDVVNRYVPLKKAGKEFQACCPFHGEKTPSFTVSQQKQFYHCFGCGAHGSAISFLMEYDHMGFVDAVEELAHQMGVEVPREEGFSTGPDLRPLYDVMQRSVDFYRQQLRNRPRADLAINYLKQRGLSGEIAARFDIGFAPPGWDGLIKSVGAKEQDLKRLRITGMTSDPDGKCYDRFRERIMFPLRDQRGRTIAFGARIIGDGKPKYLNSPETPLFHKGKELYGLYEVHKALRKIVRLLVVEGYMDVVSLAQYGIDYAVATLGTATTPDHLDRLFKTCSEVTFSFDGDRAGREAAWKAMNVALPMMRDGRELRFLLLPDGEDPDTLVRKEGKSQFEERVAAALPLSTFLFDQLASQVDTSTIDGRAHMGQLAKPLLERLPEGLFREMMFQRLNELVGLKRNPPKRVVRRVASGSSGTTKRVTPVRKAIALLMQYPELAQSLADVAHQEWRELEMLGIPLLVEIIDLLNQRPDLSAAALLERWRGRDEFSSLQRLQYYDIEIDQGHDSELLGVIGILQREWVRRHETSLLSKLSPSDMTDEEKASLIKQLSERAALQKKPGELE